MITIRPHTEISVSLSTKIGTITLYAVKEGLTRITLTDLDKHSVATPNTAYPTYPFWHLADRQIREYLAGNRHFFDLPLVICGTAFQKKVWKIIQEIPYGQTMSYGDIAGKLGHKSKAQAVGGAAHANPLPLVIPCHRVIGADGSLTGFGGGLALKKLLLELEHHHRSS